MLLSCLSLQKELSVETDMDSTKGANLFLAHSIFWRFLGDALDHRAKKRLFLMLDPDRVAVSLLFGLFAWVFAHAWVLHAGEPVVVRKAEPATHWNASRALDLEQNATFKVTLTAGPTKFLPCSSIAKRKKCKLLQHCSYNTARGCISRDQQNLVPELKAWVRM